MYNYGCGPGQGWTTTYIPDGLGTRTYTFVVDSVNSVLINSTSLKQLFVTYKYDYNIGVQTYTASIKERLGWGFLFTYRNNSGACDNDYFIQDLCYRDDIFGEYRFSEYPCDYSNPAGINAVNSVFSDIQIFPNPVQNLLVINSNTEYSFILTDIMGVPQTLESTYQNAQSIFHLQSLPHGVYFLNIFKNERWIGTRKIIKE
jgi:hypothetical protein